MEQTEGVIMHGKTTPMPPRSTEQEVVSKLPNFAEVPKLCAALVAFKKDCPAIPMNKKVSYDSRSGKKEWQYASLDKIIEITNPILTTHGLCVIWIPLASNKVQAVLLHESGESIHGQPFDVPHANDAQSIGGALTYSRRYSYCALLGIAADQDDDIDRIIPVDAPPPQQQEETNKKKKKKLSADGFQKALTQVRNGEISLARTLKDVYDLTEDQLLALQEASDEWQRENVS